MRICNNSLVLLIILWWMNDDWLLSMKMSESKFYCFYCSYFCRSIIFDSWIGENDDGTMNCVHFLLFVLMLLFLSFLWSSSFILSFFLWFSFDFDGDLHLRYCYRGLYTVPEFGNCAIIRMYFLIEIYAASISNLQHSI